MMLEALSRLALGFVGYKFTMDVSKQVQQQDPMFDGGSLAIMNGLVGMVYPPILLGGLVYFAHKEVLEDSTARQGLKFLEQNPECQAVQTRLMFNNTVLMDRKYYQNGKNDCLHCYIEPKL